MYLFYAGSPEDAWCGGGGGFPLLGLRHRNGLATHVLPPQRDAFHWKSMVGFSMNTPVLLHMPPSFSPFSAHSVWIDRFFSYIKICYFLSHFFHMVFFLLVFFLIFEFNRIITNCRTILKYYKLDTVLIKVRVSLVRLWNYTIFN